MRVIKSDTDEPMTVVWDTTGTPHKKHKETRMGKDGED